MDIAEHAHRACMCPVAVICKRLGRQTSHQKQALPFNRKCAALDNDNDTQGKHRQTAGQVNLADPDGSKSSNPRSTPAHNCYCSDTKITYLHASTSRRDDQYVHRFLR